MNPSVSTSDAVARPHSDIQPLRRQATPQARERIPFNKPYLTGQEFTYMREAVANRSISGDGFFTKRCSQWFEQYFRSPRTLLTTSCTHALEMAAILLDIGPGDEVIVPSFTFVSTVNAFVLRGAKPVFIDIHPDTLNLNETLLEKLITPKTKAILPVHYAGVACEMDTILSIAQKYNIPVIEDNAHGLFGYYKNKPLGSFGAMATLSFHETKNLTCGEGGALIINDKQYVQRAEIIREKGTNRSEFFRGHADKYTWKDVGSSYLPSDMLAAYLWAQIENADFIQKKRMQIWNRYFYQLSDWAEQVGAKLPSLVNESCHPAHLFYVLMPDMDKRDRLLKQLNNHGIGAVFHYLPLHLSEMGKLLAPESFCPVTENVGGRLLRLPIYVELSEDRQNKIIERVRQFC